MEILLIVSCVKHRRLSEKKGSSYSKLLFYVYNEWCNTFLFISESCVAKWQSVTTRMRWGAWSRARVPSRCLSSARLSHDETEWSELNREEHYTENQKGGIRHDRMYAAPLGLPWRDYPVTSLGNMSHLWEGCPLQESMWWCHWQREEAW